MGHSTVSLASAAGASSRAEFTIETRSGTASTCRQIAIQAVDGQDAAEREFGIGP
jgi:hypothetical protein